MSDFPRTDVGGLSLSRMIIGTNWFLGWSHCTPAKDTFIKEHFGDYKKVADIIEVFLNGGVDTIMGLINSPILPNAVEEAKQRTGKDMIVVSTPSFPTDKNTPVDGFDTGEVERILDEQVEFGASVCMPHTSTTDAMLDKCTREIRKMDVICEKIRERGMVPGLSTHVPEAIIYADETGLDVETYISLYNLMGFLMQVEVDWINRVIHNAKKPVMTIKPFAAGQVRPFQGLTFSWNTLRDCDMVTVGTMTPREAAELIDMSLDILSRRPAEMELQRTRSKESVESAGGE
ncbi:MAG TPA: hypothetical protein QGH10_08065 [Armatimonadota bacterium]|nr:hypothetical protein [Armatimonadota bacterium]